MVSENVANISLFATARAGYGPDAGSVQIRNTGTGFCIKFVANSWLIRDFAPVAFSFHIYLDTVPYRYNFPNGK